MKCSHVVDLSAEVLAERIEVDCLRGVPVAITGEPVRNAPEPVLYVPVTTLANRTLEQRENSAPVGKPPPSNHDHSRPRNAGNIRQNGHIGRRWSSLEG